MKTEITSPKQVFIPVGINFTCETQEELDKFYTLASHDFFTKYFDKHTAHEIAKTLEDAGAHHNRFLDYINHCMKDE